MPPDTIYIPGVTGPPPVLDSIIDSIEINSLLLKESMQRHIDSLGEVYLRNKTNERPQYLMPEWQMFLVVLVIVYLLVIRPFFAERKEVRQKIDQRLKKVEGREFQYDYWLKRYNPYYAALPEELKNLFLKRTVSFLRAKEFRFHAMVEEEYIPVLISGAAVQMMFGIKNYLMDYFDVIHVIRKEYTLDVNKETYYGHVSQSGIYISWGRFLEGYENYDDSVNVGLHEMAHAVSYDIYLGSDDEDDLKFKERLTEFNIIAKPVFRALKNGADSILDAYAATNFDEFWAVCMETFFENPQEFKRTMPDLYLSVCDLLNQDPLTPDKIINKELAGLAN